MYIVNHKIVIEFMKKTYITPTSKAVKLEGNELLAGSLGVNNGPKDGVSGDAKGMNDEWED